MKFWLKIGGILAAVWIVIALICHFASASRPTAESVRKYVNTLNLDALNGTGRARAIAKVEDMMNHVTFEERQDLDRDAIGRDFFKKLTPEEQVAYLDATLPTGFQQLMDSFNKMDPARRKDIVNHALEEMKKRDGQNMVDPNNQLAQHVLDQGIKSYYRDANADVKMDLAPLMEQMQHDFQRP
jgi:hypothetical protein